MGIDVFLKNNSCEKYFCISISKRCKNKTVDMFLLRHVIDFLVTVRVGHVSYAYWTVRVYEGYFQESNLWLHAIV